MKTKTKTGKFLSDENAVCELLNSFYEDLPEYHVFAEVEGEHWVNLVLVKDNQNVVYITPNVEAMAAHMDMIRIDKRLA